VKSFVCEVPSLLRKEKMMILPEYVTATEVGRVCAEIGLDDWSKRM
jgi:hypothetical protein